MNNLSHLQDIPPKAARFCLSVQEFLEGELGLSLRGTHILTAFSGGVDSTTLLLLFKLLSSRLGCTVSAAHLDHALREESPAEAEHAAKICARLGIPFFSTRIDVGAFASERGMGLEEAARTVRYAFLEEQRQRCNADYIALGHNLNDLAEDSLMRLSRGTGWPQLAGMQAFNPERALLRPMLMCSREDIEAFATGLDVKWVEDPSNADTRYTRNRMRHELLPLFMRENPGFLNTVATRWRLAQKDATFWDAQLAKLIASAEQDATGAYTLSAPKLRMQHTAMRLRLFKILLERLGPGQVRADSLFRLEETFQRGEGGKTLQFPGDKRVVLSSRSITFLPKKNDFL